MGKYGLTTEKGIYPEDVLKYYGATEYGSGPEALGIRWGCLFTPDVCYALKSSVWSICPSIGPFIGPSVHRSIQSSVFSFTQTSKRHVLFTRSVESALNNY